MTDEQRTPEPSAEAKATANGTGGIGSVIYKFALAGIGALMLAQEEIEAAWKKRGADKSATGEAAPADPNAKPEPAPKAGAPDGTRVSAQIDGAITRFLKTLAIPTRDELAALSTKIEALSKKLDARDQKRRR
jgi:hypothetical protein